MCDICTKYFMYSSDDVLFLISCRCNHVLCTVCIPYLYQMNKNQYCSFQYSCCLHFNITKEHTLHIITHYFKGMTFKKLHEEINVFAEQNISWIRKVGVSKFNKFSMSPQDYIQNLVSRDIVLDELALLIAARVLNIHCVVLMANRYWLTKSDGSYENCLLKLAFTGNSSFKELTLKQAEELAEVDEDLEGTGLVDNGDESQSEGDSDSGCSCEGSCNCSNPSDVPSSQYNGDSDDPSVIILSSDEVDLATVRIHLMFPLPSTMVILIIPLLLFIFR